MNPALAAIRQQATPASAARPSEVLPLDPTLAEALDLQGLRRGSTLVVTGPSGSGATSLGLSLLAAATKAGMWCAVVGLPDLGLVAVSELGVDLDRLALVAGPKKRTASVLAALVEGCEALLLGFSLPLTRAEALRLAARARQRGVVLVVLADPASRVLAWPEAPDVTVTIRQGELLGIGPGTGRIAGRRCELVTSKRRGASGPRVASWIVAPEESVARGLLSTASEGSVSETTEPETTEIAAGAASFPRAVSQ